MERLAGLEMVCTDAGGRWNDDNTCTSVADLETERLAGLQTTCEDAGGRWNAGGADDPSCTSAADLETERLAGLQTTCEDAGGRWNAGGADDPSCTSAADLETERLAGLQTTCEDAGGRWNAGGADDPSCTSAADLETERLAGLQTTCEDAGGRWNAGGADDPSCTSAADLAMERAETQRADINTKIEAAGTAVGAVNDGAVEATVTAANEAISAASMAVADAGDLDDNEKAALNRAIALIQSNLTARESSRQMAMEAERVAMAAMAGKLHAGIGENPLATSGDGRRTAVYSGTNGTEITVTRDVTDGTDGTDIIQMLKATTKMFDPNHGWDGKQYTASGTGIGGTYEAMVYSNVEAPTQGKKFGSPAANDDKFEYPLTEGEYLIDTSTAAVQARVGSPSFDQLAGLKRFPVTPVSENPNEESRVTLPGTFHGVSGTYICTPGSDAVCASQVAADGFELGTVPSATDTTFTPGSWKFMPTNPNARVTDMEDINYASYGTLSAARRVERTTLVTSPRGQRSKPTSPTMQTMTPSAAPSTCLWARTGCRGTGRSRWTGPPSATPGTSVTRRMERLGPSTEREWTLSPPAIGPEPSWTTATTVFRRSRPERSTRHSGRRIPRRMAAWSAPSG